MKDIDGALYALVVVIALFGSKGCLTDDSAMKQAKALERIATALERAKP